MKSGGSNKNKPGAAIPEQDGQHRQPSGGAPDASSGQRSRVTPEAVVGNKSGGESHDEVPAPRRDALINYGRGRA